MGGMHGAPPLGIDLTMRSISQIPPTLEDLQVPPQDLAEALFVRNGIVIIGGETGSGKTTLLGATVRKALTDPMGKRILSYESPIEFDFRAIPGRTGGESPSRMCMSISRIMHMLRLMHFVGIRTSFFSVRLEMLRPLEALFRTQKRGGIRYTPLCTLTQ